MSSKNDGTLKNHCEPNTATGGPPSGQDESPGPQKTSGTFLERSFPTAKNDALAAPSNGLDNRIRKLLPPLFVVREGLPCSDGKRCVERQHALLSPSRQAAVRWRRNAQVALKLFVDVLKRQAIGSRGQRSRHRCETNPSTRLAHPRPTTDTEVERSITEAEPTGKPAGQDNCHVRRACCESKRKPRNG